jgi:hypothetical protein
MNQIKNTTPTLRFVSVSVVENGLLIIKYLCKVNESNANKLLVLAEQSVMSQILHKTLPNGQYFNVVRMVKNESDMNPIIMLEIVIDNKRMIE